MLGISETVAGTGGDCDDGKGAGDAAADCDAGCDVWSRNWSRTGEDGSGEKDGNYCGERSDAVYLEVHAGLRSEELGG